MKIKDVMSTPVVVVPPITPVRDVARHMDYSGVGCVVVSDGHGGVGGIVTDRDLAVRVLAQGGSADMPVGRVMTRDPIVVGPEDEVEAAFDVFRRHSFRRLPVADEEGVVGMLTIDDLLLQMQQLSADLLTPVVKEISEPQRQSD